MKQGKISISRSMSGDGIGIDIIDENDTMIVRLMVSPEEFGNAIVGRSERPMEIIKRF